MQPLEHSDRAALTLQAEVLRIQSKDLTFRPLRSHRQRRLFFDAFARYLHMFCLPQEDVLSAGNAGSGSSQ